MFSASLVRARQCSEKLQISPGKWLLAPSGRVISGTWPCLRWRHQPPRREPSPRPFVFLQGIFAKQSIWTQAGCLRAGRSGDDSKHVSMQRDQKEETLLSAAQKGGLFYVIFKELFSSSSPSKIYGDALEKCRSHPEIMAVFGEPIKGYGEATRRGRRQLVSHIEYIKDGLKHMRLKFYIEGSEPGKRGTVHVEVKENPERGRFEVRYIFVDVDTFPRRTIIIEDNR
ncbi:mitochondrial import inner membrane translocase subunit Tim21 isoform X2 [Apteryx rowi]|uniref:mitochondrial import inner membrane translocase subunit Tim21 isoform X2 n=1 Tax=Apteryx rowi TaxID=308060 RepID=UPI000E1C96FF|nr:mitochondrial import inner membrane translocase subunit Tim21 isoform X2 [Apteryx rowi]